jgi:cytidylate kinase
LPDRSLINISLRFLQRDGDRRTRPQSTRTYQEIEEPEEEWCKICALSEHFRMSRRSGNLVSNLIRSITMPTLLVSRGSMSGGQIIAQSLSHSSGLRCVTREDLVPLVNQYGELAARVTASIGEASRNYEKFSELRRPFKILMRMALLEYARQESLAYFGYSGHLLVEGISHFIRVRLIAPIGLRIKTTMERLHCTEDEARDYIMRFDEERTQWARFMYGKNISDPRLYDLCINLDRMSFSTVCSMLINTVREKEFQPTEESLAVMENTYTATRVEAALVTDPRTHAYEISATFNSGTARLKGPYLDDAERSLVLNIAASVPGIEHLDYEPGYAPNLEFLP